METNTRSERIRLREALSKRLTSMVRSIHEDLIKRPLFAPFRECVDEEFQSRHCTCFGSSFTDPRPPLN